MVLEARESTDYEASSSDTFCTPFALRVDPMQRLLLINWKDGTRYKGAEPQYFDDRQHGRGLLVILYRLDDKVDVYYQLQLTLDAKGYEIQSGLGEMVASEFERDHFEIGEHGVDADIAFRDKEGRAIELRIQERRGKRAGDFSLLAPMGMSISDPEAMPLLFLYDFSFVKVGGTEARVTVDGERRKMLGLPVPMGGSRVYLTRYCGDPFIAFWNAEVEGPLATVKAEGSVAHVDGVRYALVRHEGSYEIAAMARGQQNGGDGASREVQIRFDPPFPDVRALRDGASLSGAFRIHMEPTPEAGEVGGEWQATREGDKVRLRLHPSKGWKSGERSLTPRLIFTVARPFTQWPKSYEWTATVDLAAEGGPAMVSRWERV